MTQNAAITSDHAVRPERRTVALVDDDRNILTTVSIALQAEGYAVNAFHDSETALDALLDNPPDLAVFDIKMPRLDGMELLRRLRVHSNLPVIFLTSKDDERDEEAGLELGADDYIAKPFSLRLLSARIRTILRRTGLGDPLPERAQDGPEPDPRDEPPAPSAPLSIDPARHRVAWKGRPVSLTVTEFLILDALASEPGVIRSRAELTRAAYPDDSFVDDRTVDSHIKRIRRKFRAVDPEFASIDTLYGAGYSFADG